MDIKQRIEIAKVNVEKAKTAKTVAETNKANAEKQLEEVVAKIIEAGTTPEALRDEITQLEVKLEADVEKIERLIPKVY